MFNSKYKKYIKSLENRNEELISIGQEWLEKYKNARKDIEMKEDSIVNLLQINKEQALENEYLRNKIKLLESIIKKHQENECNLNKKYITEKKKIEKLDDWIKRTSK